jgi:hypothetical protein
MANDELKDDPYAEIPVKDFSYTNSANLRQPKNPSNNTKWIAIGGTVALILVLVVVGFLVLHHKKTPAPKAKITSSNKVQQSAFDLSFNPSANYNSNNFNLTVNYPKAWKVNETATSLTILSPVTQLKDDSAKLVSAKVLLSVFDQDQIPTAFGTNGSAVAVLSSTKINYSSPSTVQAAQTYLTFVQYPATTATGGLDAIYVTGNDGYTFKQNIPNTDIANINPLVVISFLGCSNTQCDTPTALTISSTEWANPAFSNLVQQIVKSFVFD